MKNYTRGTIQRNCNGTLSPSEGSKRTLIKEHAKLSSYQSGTTETMKDEEPLKKLETIATIENGAKFKLKRRTYK